MPGDQIGEAFVKVAAKTGDLRKGFVEARAVQREGLQAIAADMSAFSSQFSSRLAGLSILGGGALGGKLLADLLQSFDESRLRQSALGRRLGGVGIVGREAAAFSRAAEETRQGIKGRRRPGELRRQIGPLQDFSAEELAAVVADLVASFQPARESPEGLQEAIRGVVGLAVKAGVRPPQVSSALRQALTGGGGAVPGLDTAAAKTTAEVARQFEQRGQAAFRAAEAVPVQRPIGARIAESFNEAARATRAALTETQTVRQFIVEEAAGAIARIAGKGDIREIDSGQRELDRFSSFAARLTSVLFNLTQDPLGTLRGLETEREATQAARLSNAFDVAEEEGRNRSRMNRRNTMEGEPSLGDRAMQVQREQDDTRTREERDRKMRDHTGVPRR